MILNILGIIKIIKPRDMGNSLREKIFTKESLKMMGRVAMEFLIIVMKQLMRDIG